MKHQVVSATEFKAKCLALLDEIDEHGGSITVTKRGRAVATLGPAKKEPWKSLRGILAAKGRITGDIVSPNTADWEVMTDPGRFFPRKKK